MRQSTKNLMGIASFIPLLLFIIGIIYYVTVLSPLIANAQLHQGEKVAGYTNANYGSLLTLGTIFGIAAAFVLIWFAVHLLRLSAMAGSTKLGWLVFMLIFNFVAFPVFWFLEIRKETPDTPMFSSIEQAHG